MLRSPDVLVVCVDSPSENDRRAAAVAEFLGATVEFISTQSLAAASAQGTYDSGTSPNSCAIASADTLATIQGIPAALSVLRGRLIRAGHLLIFGFNDSDVHAALLSEWSSNALSGIRPLDEMTPFTVNDGRRRFCDALSGISLGRAAAARDYGFVAGPRFSALETLIRADQAPVLARATSAGGHVYFVATPEVADLDEPIARGADIVQWFSRLAPLMMVLRGVLGDRVWRNRSPRACFIIDDPLLTARYGFLDYRRFVEAMRAHRFFPCVAFIPWNHGRSNRDVAALLASRYDEPFLCVHGCDHTRGEFETTDATMLDRKASLALHRMQEHARVAGVPFDDVMVFPQGLFSPEAIDALRRCGYLAAVNSDVCPSTGSSARLALRDLLDVAVTRFADFPLFGRRYPRDLGALAFDLFLGKPALAVEHHGYFRDGYSALAEFVDQLNRLEPALEWSSLGVVCSSAALTRTAGDGEVHVQFFSTRFLLSNDEAQTMTYVLTRRNWLTESPTVSINGRETPSEVADNVLRMRVTLAPGETAAVRIGRAPAHGPTPLVRQRGPVKVRLRRRLSEFRDNYVDTNPLLQALTAAARSRRRAVPVSGAETPTIGS